MISLCFYTSQAAPSVGTILQQPAGAINHNSSVTFTGSYTSFLNATVVKWQKLNGSNYIDIDITTDKYTGSSVLNLLLIQYNLLMKRHMDLWSAMELDPPRVASLHLM